MLSRGPHRAVLIEDHMPQLLQQPHQCQVHLFETRKEARHILNNHQPRLQLLAHLHRMPNELSSLIKALLLASDAETVAWGAGGAM